MWTPHVHFLQMESKKYFVYAHSTIFQLVVPTVWAILKGTEKSNKENMFFLQGARFQWQNMV